MGQARSDSRRLSIPAGLTPLALLLGMAGMIVVGQLSRNWHLGTRVTLLVAEATLALPATAMALGFGVPFDCGVGLNRTTSRALCLSLAFGSSLWILSLGLLELQYSLWRPPGEFIESMRLLHQALRPQGPIDAIGSVLAIAIAPAAFEELAFRGVFFPSLAARLGLTGGAIASALLFGFIHIDQQVFYRAPFAFAIGCALAFLRHRTGSLLPPIVTHASLNTITFLLAPLVDDPNQPLPDPRPFLGLAVFTAGTLLSGLLYRSFRLPVESRGGPPPRAASCSPRGPDRSRSARRP